MKEKKDNLLCCQVTATACTVNLFCRTRNLLKDQNVKIFLPVRLCDAFIKHKSGPVVFINCIIFSFNHINMSKIFSLKQFNYRSVYQIIIITYIIKSQYCARSNVTHSCKELKPTRFMYGFSPEQTQRYCSVPVSVPTNPRGVIKQSVVCGRSLSV